MDFSRMPRGLKQSVPHDACASPQGMKVASPASLDTFSQSREREDGVRAIKSYLQGGHP